MKLMNLLYSSIIQDDILITIKLYGSDLNDFVSGFCDDAEILGFRNYNIEYFIYNPDNKRLLVMLRGIEDIDRKLEMEDYL